MIHWWCKLWHTHINSTSGSAEVAPVNMAKFDELYLVGSPRIRCANVTWHSDISQMLLCINSSHMFQQKLLAFVFRHRLILGHGNLWLRFEETLPNGRGTRWRKKSTTDQRSFRWGCEPHTFAHQYPSLQPLGGNEVTWRVKRSKNKRSRSKGVCPSPILLPFLGSLASRLDLVKQAYLCSTSLLPATSWKLHGFPSSFHWGIYTLQGSIIETLSQPIVWWTRQMAASPWGKRCVFFTAIFYACWNVFFSICSGPCQDIFWLKCEVTFDIDVCGKPGLFYQDLWLWTAGWPRSAENWCVDLWVSTIWGHELLERRTWPRSWIWVIHSGGCPPALLRRSLESKSTRRSWRGKG